MLRKIIVGTVITFQAFASSAQEIKDNAATKSFAFYVGTYTRGESEGIYRYELNADGTLNRLGLAATTENPSFLAKSDDQKYLLAVNETRDDSGGGGTVTSFAIDGDRLSLIDKKSSGGASPCYVSIDPSGYVLAANYSSGNVGLLKLASSGTLSGPLDILQHEGQGDHARQKGPHAHSAWFDSVNAIITVDLGTNELWFSQLDRNNDKLTPMKPNKLAMAPGSGPRHMTFHPKNPWAYVVNELSSTVTQLKKTAPGKYEIVSTQSTLPAGYDQANTCADIHISDDGRFLYASNRGHNSIVIYSVDESDGSLQLIGHQATRGDSPRNFTLSPDGAYLLVANQRSNNIISFKRDGDKGTLTFVDEIQAPSPVCLLF